MKNPNNSSLNILKKSLEELSLALKEALITSHEGGNSLRAEDNPLPPGGVKYKFYTDITFRVGDFDIEEEYVGLSRAQARLNLLDWADELFDKFEKWGVEVKYTFKRMHEGTLKFRYFRVYHITEGEIALILLKINEENKHKFPMEINTYKIKYSLWERFRYTILGQF